MTRFVLTIGILFAGATAVPAQDWAKARLEKSLQEVRDQVRIEITEELRKEFEAQLHQRIAHLSETEAETERVAGKLEGVAKEITAMLDDPSVDLSRVMQKRKEQAELKAYLDGLRYTIIGERGTRLAALQTGRLDAFVPLEMTKIMADSVKQNAPSLVITEVGQNGSDNVVLNHKRPPFDNPAVRRAISLAMDRHAFVQGVRHGGAVVGASMMPKPLGIWGLLDQDFRTLPGYRGSAQDKAEAKRLLAAAGYGPGKPLRVEMVTRSSSIYLDVASFVVDQLRQVGVEATLKQLDTGAWFPALARRDYQIGANLTAGGFDDPDAYYYENYKCGASRNYTDYCNEETDKLIDLQSQELDRGKRLKLVWEIQRKLEADVARPMLSWRKEYFAQWPYVKNLVPHNALYNYGRMQDVWLDK